MSLQFVVDPQNSPAHEPHAMSIQPALENLPAERGEVVHDAPERLEGRRAKDRRRLWLWTDNSHAPGGGKILRLQRPFQSQFRFGEEAQIDHPAPRARR